MANLLLNPALWQDYDGVSPPAYWNTLAYSMHAADIGGGGSYLRMTLPGAGAPGDTLEAAVSGSGFSGSAYTNLVQSGAVVASFAMDGVERPLSIPAVAGARFVVATSAGGINPVTVYGGTSLITPPTPEAIDPIYQVPHYFRAYFGEDTPMRAYIREEEGAPDLSGDTITVRVRWPWMVWADIPATGFADGHVEFVVPSSLLWRYWGNDYGIRLGTYRGTNSLVRIVSVERGMLGLGYLEVA